MGDKTSIIYDNGLLAYDFGRGHPLRPERLSLTYELMDSIGILKAPQVFLEFPVSAEVEQILLFHDEKYIERVRSMSSTGHGFLDSGDTPAFKKCFEASLLYVGASLQAADLLMTGEAIHAFNPAGGLHHAFPSKASGFCIFNDAAIVVAYLKKKYRVKRMMYLDVDAHHGDGIMYGYYRDGSLLNIDFHEDGRYLFPGSGFVHEIGEGEGKGLKMNVPLPPQTGDRSYLKAFHDIVPTATRAYAPEIILMQCGADSHRDDTLAELGITTRCYDEMVLTIRSLAQEVCGGKVLLFGGGGYNLSSVARCWTIAFGRLAGIDLPSQIPENWRMRYEELVGHPAPLTLHDSPRVSSLKTSSDSQVDHVLSSLKEQIPLLRGGGPARI